MSRRLRNKLAASLRQQQRDSWWETTAVLRLPQTLTGGAPVWSPGPQYMQALSATVWAHVTDPLRAHALRRLVSGCG